MPGMTANVRMNLLVALMMTAVFSLSAQNDQPQEDVCGECRT
jgi:hypothetical protein